MPNSLVIDASLALRLVLPDPRRGLLRGQMEQWLAEGYELVAPDLWLYEMTSALSKAVFFGLLAGEEAETSLALVSTLPVRLLAVDAEQARRAFAWTRRLNRAAAYDSFYLALAESLGYELWTADRRLHGAVGLPWVQLA